MKKEQTLRVCPKCNKEFIVKEKAFLPFCSKRCKMIDLGHWLSEKYVVDDKGQSTKKDDNET